MKECPVCFKSEFGPQVQFQRFHYHKNELVLMRGRKCLSCGYYVQNKRG